MEAFTIEVRSRAEVGRLSASRVRSKGQLPGILYHAREGSFPIALNTKEFTLLAQRAKVSQLFSLKSDDTRFNGRRALVRDIQKDYLKRSVSHVDLQLVREDEELSVPVRIKITGEAPGVKLDGGILTVVSQELFVRCLPKNIPEELVCDVSSLKLNENIHAAALPLPPGVRLDGTGKETIVSVVAPKAEEEATTAAAAPGDAAAAAAPAADGAAPAAAATPAAGAAAPAKGEEKKGK